VSPMTVSPSDQGWEWPVERGERGRLRCQPFAAALKDDAEALFARPTGREELIE
jgi:hypothetical protein